jgi:uncharacterized protein YmfQ (DUF2313 family)
MSARFAAGDYAAAAAALLPRGRVWNGQPGSVQGTALLALAQSLEQSDADAAELLDESLPHHAVALLPEWEASLGLPDPCIGPDASDAQRREQVKARFVGGGGQSRQRYIDFAAALGFQITITAYAPFRAGYSRAGDPLYSAAYAFVWGVTIVANTGGLPSDVLTCELEAVKPADTNIILLS